MANEILLRAANGARIVEAVENYARAEVNASPSVAAGQDQRWLYDDETFWSHVFNSKVTPGTRVSFPEVAVSEWVARVPGLFWTDAAKRLRRQGETEVEGRHGRIITLRPFGKSQVVSGGVGTLRLPPSQEDYHLVTVTSTGNASAGIPALISPEVWEHHRL